MASRRKLIRKSVIDLLLNQTNAKEKVFPNLSTSVWDDQLPAITVYPRGEDISELSNAPREYKRELKLMVEIFAGGVEEPYTDGKETIDDQLDEILEQVECALETDDTLGKTADTIVLQGIEFEFEGNGSRPIGSARLDYIVTYVTASPETIEKQGNLGDFEKLQGDWRVGHDDSDPDTSADPESTDDIDIPQ